MNMINGKDHLAMGKWVLALRAVQIAFAVVVLGCSAFGIYYVAFNAYCLSLFTAIAAIITTTYILISETVGKKAYNFWALLVLEVFNVIFWLSTFAVLADLLVASIAYFDAVDTYCYSYYNCYKKRDLLQTRDVTVADYRNVIAVALAFSVIEFLLFVTTLIVVSIAVHRHRKNTSAPSEVAMEAAVNQDVKRDPVEPATVAQPADVHQLPDESAHTQQQIPSYSA